MEQVFNPECSSDRVCGFSFQRHQMIFLPFPIRLRKTRDCLEFILLCGNLCQAKTITMQVGCGLHLLRKWFWMISFPLLKSCICPFARKPVMFICKWTAKVISNACLGGKCALLPIISFLSFNYMLRVITETKLYVEKCRSRVVF